ncbi:MAG TPA: hypothetical protein VIN11_06170 [Roseivirga sp.]
MSSMAPELLEMIGTLTNRVASLKESLFERKIYNVDQHICQYGTFVSSYAQYEIQQIKDGHKPTTKRYFEGKLAEIETLLDSLPELERNLQLKKGIDMKFHALYSELMLCKRIAKDAIENRGRASNNKSLGSNKSFEWVDSKNWNLVGVLYNLLKEMQLIDGNTKKTDFNTIFRGGKVETKIRWIGNVNELNFFVKILVSNGIVKAGKSRWETAVYCFEGLNNENKQYNSQMVKQNNMDPSVQVSSAIEKAIGVHDDTSK